MKFLHVLVEQQRKKYTKKRDARAKLLLCLLFCRSRCCRPRHCLKLELCHDGNGNETSKSTSFRLAKQLYTCCTIFGTFASSRLIENVNERRQISLPLFERRYYSWQYNPRRVRLHLKKWASWEVTLQVTFSPLSPSWYLQLPLIALVTGGTVLSLPG